MQEKVDGIYEFTGLREFADLPLKYYSSGMYTRLAFAIATEIDPDILLIDESLGAGDAAFVDKAKARIQRPARPLERRRHRLARPELAARDVHAGPLDAARAGSSADGPIDEVIDRYLEHAAGAADGLRRVPEISCIRSAIEVFQISNSRFEICNFIFKISNLKSQF